jgi:hypothetical protein
MTGYSTMIAGLGDSNDKSRTLPGTQISLNDGYEDLLGMRIANQGNNRENTATRSNGHASTSVRGTGEMKQSVMDGIHGVGSATSNPLSPRRRVPTGAANIQRRHPRSEAERQQLVLQNCCTRTDSGNKSRLLECMSPRWVVVPSTPPSLERRGSTGHRTADQDYILKRCKTSAHLDAMLALDLRKQTTTGQAKHGVVSPSTTQSIRQWDVR